MYFQNVLCLIGHKLTLTANYSYDDTPHYYVMLLKCKNTTIHVGNAK